MSPCGTTGSAPWWHVDCDVRPQCACIHHHRHEGRSQVTAMRSGLLHFASLHITAAHTRPVTATRTRTRSSKEQDSQSDVRTANVHPLSALTKHVRDETTQRWDIQCTIGCQWRDNGWEKPSSEWTLSHRWCGTWWWRWRSEGRERASCAWVL